MLSRHFDEACHPMVLVLCDFDTHFYSVKACKIKTERTVWSVKKEHG